VVTEKSEAVRKAVPRFGDTSRIG